MHENCMKNSIFKCLITALLIQFVCTLKAQVTYTVNGIVYYAVDKEASVVESQSGYKGEVIIPQSVRLKLPMVMSYVEKTLPVTSISGQAFSKSRELLKVGIPNSITYIGDCAFEGCSGLSTIVLPNSVKTIGFNAFQNCVGLYEITLPNSIEYIEEGLFKGCNKIRVIKCYNPNPPSIGYEAFETEVEENAIVYVPKGLKEKYKTNPYWKGFANISDDSENISSVGSSTVATTTEEGVFEIVDEVASFPGGQGEMYQWLAKVIKYPLLAFEREEQGRVLVKVIIDKDGSITYPKISKSVSESLDKEALRVVNLMPKWKPAVKNGKNVRMYYTIPITFKL